MMTAKPRMTITNAGNDRLLVTLENSFGSKEESISLTVLIAYREQTISALQIDALERAQVLLAGALRLLRQD